MADVNAPFKKRRSKFMAERTPAPSDHLLRPLSPISPPLPEDSLHSQLLNPCGSLLPNGLAFSPLPSLPASRCNTPLQFEVREQPRQHFQSRLFEMSWSVQFSPVLKSAIPGWA